MKDNHCICIHETLSAFSIFYALSQQLTLCSTAIASRLSAIQTHYEERSASTSKQQFYSVLEKFSFVLMAKKQFDSTVEWMISAHKNSNFASKCRQPFDFDLLA